MHIFNMASSTEVEELESWEDLTDEILDRNLAKMKAITTAEKPSVEQSPTTVLLDSNDFRSRFLNQHNTPAVKILKRPNAQMTSQGAQMSQCADGDGREGQKPHRKSLQQREMEYAQARLRILGQAHCEEEKEPTFQERVRQIQNKTTSPSANSDATISTTNHLTSTLSPQSPAFVSHNHNHMATATTTVHTAPQFANSAVNHNGTLYYAAVPFQGQQSPNSGGVQSSVAYVGNNGPLNYTYGSNGLLATDPTAGLQMLSINPVQTTVGGTAGYQTVGNSAGYSTVGNSCCCSTVGNSGAVPTVGNRVNVITRFDASTGLQMIGVNTGVIFDSNGTVISVGSPAQVNMPGNSQRIPTLTVKPVQTTVGNTAGYSTVGNSAGYSTVGNPCSFTTVGNSAGYSTVGNPCSCTTVGNSAGYSTVGNSVGYSTVGSSVGFSTVSYPGCCTTVANTSSFSTVGVPTVTNSSAETVSGPKFVHPNHESFNNQKTEDQKKAAGLKSVEVIRQPKGPDGTKGFQFNMRR